MRHLNEDIGWMYDFYNMKYNYQTDSKFCFYQRITIENSHSIYTNHALDTTFTFLCFVWCLLGPYWSKVRIKASIPRVTLRDYNASTFPLHYKAVYKIFERFLCRY